MAQVQEEQQPNERERLEQERIASFLQEPNPPPTMFGLSPEQIEAELKARRERVSSILDLHPNTPLPHHLHTPSDQVPEEIVAARKDQDEMLRGISGHLPNSTSSRP